MDEEMSDQEPVALHQMGDLKVTEGGNVYLKDKLVQGATFDQPIKVSDEDISTEPTPMLYQPPFYLSEAAFEKIRRPSGKLAGFGWSCIGLSALNALRLLLKLSESGFSLPSLASLKLEAVTTLVILIVGAISLGLSSRFSRTKNAILKEIESHFESNKPKLEIRRTEKTK
jgi:hypothetical protein